MRAANCAADAGIEQAHISTDYNHPSRPSLARLLGIMRETGRPCTHVIDRPPELSQDDTPMVDVVRHALDAVPGPPDQIIVLLQPTQPLRRPHHVRAAIHLLRETGADSVVSVVEIPLSCHPDVALEISDGSLGIWQLHSSLRYLPTRRQELQPAYRRDGTVYAFWRKTLDKHGTIYGKDVRPLVIPVAESCDLDTEDDWNAMVQRLQADGVCRCDAPQPFMRPSGQRICLNPNCGGNIVPPEPKPATP